MCSPSAPSLMTMKTSCISPSQWSKRDQHVSTPAATKAFGWLVSSETACAIWFLLDPKLVSVTRVLRFGVVRCMRQQRRQGTGKYMHEKEIVSMSCETHWAPDGKLDELDLGLTTFRAAQLRDTATARGATTSTSADKINPAGAK